MLVNENYDKMIKYIVFKKFYRIPKDFSINAVSFKITEISLINLLVITIGIYVQYTGKFIKGKI